MESAGFDKDCGALGTLFQQIVNDMKGSYPIWEDFTCKASKLHTALRTTIAAAGAFLEVFQKVADMATNTRGATRDIGVALTRLCMRHKNIDAKLRNLNCAIIDCLVNPLQERLEEWKKVGAQLDKDHMKDYKRARAELKKASSDTIRLQKKVKKGKSNIQAQLDSAMQEVSEKYKILEETEKSAVRTALIEERSRYCEFVHFLKPVLNEELGMITEISHLQEILKNLAVQSINPTSLPPASEQVILDVKGSDASLSFQFPNGASRFRWTPPSSPSSIGSRKSSMCSISSLNSSSSGSTKSHSPSHHYRSRSTSQQEASSQNSIGDNASEASSEASTPSSEPYPGPPSSASTWTNWPEQPDQTRPEHTPAERPHTISSAYEKNHSRPGLTSQTFEPPDPGLLDKNAKTPTNHEPDDKSLTAPPTPSQYARPIVNVRRASIRDSLLQERPPVGPKPKAKPVALPMIPRVASGESPPIYANVDELEAMAAQRQADLAASELPHHIPRKMSLPAQTVDLAKAIRELDAHTQALRSSDVSDSSPDWGLQMPNSQDLADAIRELEASTAALQCSYESRSSLQCSSGYGTMTNTPACSEDTIASGGVPCINSGLATLRRASLPAKPPPPVRRSSSMSGPPPVAPPTVPVVKQSSGSNTPTPQGTPTHKRSQSVSNDVQFNYAEVQRQFTSHIYGNSDTAMARGVRGTTDARTDSNSTNDVTPTVDNGGGIAAHHVNIVQSLAAKFAGLNRTDSVDDLPPPPNPEELEAMSRPAQTVDTGPQTFLSQIKQGVQLRRVQSNDRSAPKISHARF